MCRYSCILITVIRYEERIIVKVERKELGQVIITGEPKSVSKSNNRRVLVEYCKN